MRLSLRSRHYSPRTEQAYLAWIRRFIAFHGRKHPRDLGARDIEAFLDHLAASRQVSASTQNQALSALLFLYRVLERDLGEFRGVVRAKRPERLPVVLTPPEVGLLLVQMTGVTGLMSRLMYGAGLRLAECTSLRIKDLDLERRELRVRDGKGRKDRVTPFPKTLLEFPERRPCQLSAVRIHSNRSDSPPGAARAAAQRLRSTPDCS